MSRFHGVSKIMHFLPNISFTNYPGADPIKLIFFANNEFLCFFAAKLGHFIINTFFYM